MIVRGIAAALAAFAFAGAAGAQSFQPFTVKDIRVEGLQRTEPGTVFSYLPVKVGETLDEEKAQAALRALYATGFFSDVRLEHEGDVLVVFVQERPAIAQIDFSGMKEFEPDAVRKVLRENGLAEGRIFDRAVLEAAEQELKRQYLSRGLYAAEVQTTVTPLERNRVGINIAVTEGDVAKIRGINIVGAEAFSESELLGLFVLRTPGWLTWYTKHDRYAREKLAADLETAALALPEPRLPRLRHRVDAGLDHARPARHLHHGQHQRGRALQRVRRAGLRPDCWCRARSWRSWCS